MISKKESKVFCITANSKCASKRNKACLKFILYWKNILFDNGNFYFTNKIMNDENHKYFSSEIN